MANSSDDPKPLKFNMGSNWQAFVSGPLPASSADDAPLGERAAPADISPPVNSASWHREVCRLGNLSFLRSPLLQSRAEGKGWIPQYDGREILVDQWYGPNRFPFLSLWLSPEGRYPITGYSPSDVPTARDRSEAIAVANGFEIHLTTYRLTRTGASAEFEVGAYWKVSEGMWAMVSGRAQSRTEQEHLLTMIRSAEPSTRTGVAV